MRLVFFGTTDFSARMLSTLIEADYEIGLVVTLPDRPAKRGRKLIPTPVKKLALDKGLPLFVTGDMKSEEFAQAVASATAELGVVVAFKILPSSVYDAPRLGTVNIHPSLLPELRGPAPLRWALIRGYEETGITSFKLVDKTDAGNILLQKKVAVDPDETWGELFERITPIAGELLLATVEGVLTGKIEPTVQDDSLATKAPKIKAETANIDWNKPAVDVHNLIRGLAPEPGAVSNYDGVQLKFLRSKIAEGMGEPGEVIATDSKAGLIVACAEGAVEILRIQAPGKKGMDTKSFFLGNEIPTGAILR